MSKKFFISADIEGTTGAGCWESGQKGSKEYEIQRRIMTEEVLAAIKGLRKSCSDCQIVIKDAHASGHNLILADFPENCHLILGWDESPMCMMQGLDSTYDGVLLVGYHSGAGTGQSPLAHTLNSKKYANITLNGAVISEFVISYMTSMLFHVPVLFLSGDEGVCKEAKKYDKSIRTVAVQKGIGDSIISLSPAESVKKIVETSTLAVDRPGFQSEYRFPEAMHLEITYLKHTDAKRSSYYPGCYMTGVNAIGFDTGDFYEILRLLNFV